MSAATQEVRKLSKDGSVHVTDEKYNTLISSLGVVLGLIGSFFMVKQAVQAQQFWHILSFSIYGFCLVILFLASALHHGIDGSERLEKALLIFDYCAIYLMIAGTFTPMCLILLRDGMGWMVFSIIWALAIIGILLKICVPHLPKWISTLMYVGMGWMALIIVPPLFQLPVGLEVFISIGIGGAFFTFGAIIFYFEKPNPVPGVFGFHEIWHVFVLLGATSHFLALYNYVLPYGLH